MAVSELDKLRGEKDAFFRSDPHSPLTKDQRTAFSGLAYFPENPALCLDIEAALILDRPHVGMQTSSGDLRVYFRYASFQFAVEGELATLTIFADEEGYFFLPFVDSLAGQETYGAGRYLEPLALSPTQFRVDFNQAYNPYCAYNERWSCPIPPPENRLALPIRAGEKIFHRD